MRRWQDNWNNESHTEIWEELNTKRKIKVKPGPYILRWGHMPNGTYSTKEAYNILHQQNPRPTNIIWKNISKAHMWPKIATFLWLLSKWCILTWENILKRGLVGPSICHLCQDNLETFDHLFDQCPTANFLWDRIVVLCHCSKHARGNIINTISNWQDNPYTSTLLNRLWQIIPSILIWNI